MNAMLLGLFPLLAILTRRANYVLVERAWRQRAPARPIGAALLCVGFSHAVIAALAWAMPQPGQNGSDAPLRRIVPDGPASLAEPAGAERLVRRPRALHRSSG